MTFKGYVYCGISLLFALSALASCSEEVAESDDLTAQQILDRMPEVYANCTSYRDSGVVTTDFIGAKRDLVDAIGLGDDFTQRISFTTSFVRPGRFRFEYQEGNIMNRKRYIVWRDGQDVRTWWDVTPGVERQPNLGLAIAGATGVSSGSAHTIPALLLPWEVRGRRLTDLRKPKRIDDAKLRRVHCYRIRGEYGGDPMTIWIDKSSFLVRRIDEEAQFADFRTEDTTIYDPEINVTIPDKELEFNPPGQKAKPESEEG